MPGLTKVVELAAGCFFTCALVEGGEVRCWGNMGTIGEGPVPLGPRPKPLPEAGEAVHVTAGDGHACAVLRDGSMRCWGQGGAWLGRGEIGRGGGPAPVVGLSGVVHAAAGEHSTCAVLASGEVRCWGDNRSGELGDASTETRASPAEVQGVHDAVAVSATGNSGAALTREGTLWYWGMAGRHSSVPREACRTKMIGSEQSHSGVILWYCPKPLLHPEVRGARAVALGLNFSAALTSDGHVVTWDEPFTALKPLDGVTDAVAIAVGSNHGCARSRDRTVRCWSGRDEHGKASGQATDAPPDSPVVVPVP